MQRTSVDSSNLAAVGYNPSRKVLEVEFNSGSVYQYYGVPEHEYRNLMSAGSHGKYFNRHIKKGGYSYEKIS